MLAGIAAEVRHDAELPGADHVGLMVDATRRALDDAGTSGGSVAAVIVPRGSWGAGNPAARVAAAIGAPTARTVIAELGVTQTSAITRAWEFIAGGADVVVVVGGEARHRAALAHRGAHALADTVRGATPRAAPAAAETAPRDPAADDPAPDEVMAPEGSLVAGADVERHLAVPAHQYAIIESVLRHRAGRTPDEHAAHLGALWHRGAAVAAENPDAWNRTLPSASEIATPGPHNRVIAAPYTKSLVSQWTVDQAAAMVFVSAEFAAALPSPDRLIHPLAAAESNLMVPITERAELGAWPAMGAAARYVFDTCGIGAGEVDVVDLYSCFPAAVQVSAAEIGHDLARGWTVTGGMTFGGGPLNNYTFQSVVKIAELLRAQPGAVGLTTSVSGFLTKPAIALWTSGDAPEQCSWADVTAEATRLTARRARNDDAVGDGRLVGYTVIPGRDGTPARSVAVIDVGDERTLAVDDEPTDAAALLNRDAVGDAVEVVTPGGFRLV